MYPAKRSYHPLIIVMFHLQILDTEFLKNVPYSTRNSWRKQIQEKQFGYDIAQEFMQTNLNLVAIYKSKQLQRFVKFTCSIYEAYSRVMDKFSAAQKKSKEFAEAIHQAVSHLSKYVKVSVAVKLLNTSYQSYYRMKNRLVCKNSRRGRCFRLHPQQLTVREL
ncbi:MAG: hypothetical protein L6Q81_12660 [Bacteroidia bacterium]|nr:hypothetical protein [Bacteroidia bacterium]